MTSNQRRKYGQKVERINRKFEDRFLTKVQKAIQKKADAAAARLREGGVDAAYKYLSTNIINPALGEIIKALYKEVGLFHARRTYDDLKDEPVRKSFIPFLKRSGRLGFNSDWTQFVQEYLDKFLFQKIM